MDNRKIVVAFYIFCSSIVWILSRSLLQFVHSKSYEFRSLPKSQLILEGTPVILGVGLFVFLLRYAKANQFFDECVSELRKVTWPSREDVVRSTIVVMVWIVLSSVLLGGLDGMIGKIVTFFLKA